MVSSPPTHFFPNLKTPPAPAVKFRWRSRIPEVRPGAATTLVEILVEILEEPPVRHETVP